MSRNPVLFMKALNLVPFRCLKKDDGVGGYLADDAKAKILNPTLSMIHMEGWNSHV